MRSGASSLELPAVRSLRVKAFTPGARMAAEPTYDYPPEYVSTRTTGSRPIPGCQLGPADVQFAARRPTLVEVLVVLQCRLDPAKFVEALRTTLDDFASAGARRAGDTLVHGSGVRFSAVRVADALFEQQPAAECLFDPPLPGDVSGVRLVGGCLCDGAECVTLRLASGEGGKVGSIGLCFDHALCDMAGAALLLSHISYHYGGGGGPRPLSPHHGRASQAELFAGGAPGTTRSPAAETEAEELVANLEALKARRGGDAAAPLKGGCACVEWSYSADALAELKAAYGAGTRHEALFADVVLLLRTAGHPLSTASIPRNDRARANMPRAHFGNGSMLVEVAVPPPPTPRGAIAEAVRAAVTRGVGLHSNHPADVHMVSWWHALQSVPLRFGADTDPTFAIGPGTLATAARLCVLRAGQPNLTVRPAEGNGLTLSLIAPNAIASAVSDLLKRRSKLAAKGPTPQAAAAAHPAAAHPAASAPTAGKAPPAGKEQKAAAAAKEESLAATQLQSRVRGRSARLQRRAEAAAALKVQARARGRAERKQRDREASAALAMQSASRGRKGRKAAKRAAAARRAAGENAPPAPPANAAAAAPTSGDGAPPAIAEAAAPTSGAMIRPVAVRSPPPHSPPLSSPGAKGTSASSPSEPQRSALRLRAHEKKGRHHSPPLNDDGEPQRSALIWLHGVGDTGEGWRGKFDELASQVPLIECHHPTAPTQYVTAHNCEAPSWFDLSSLPIRTSEPPSPKGFAEAIAAAHALLTQVIDSGVPSRRILLGGFSQGGAVALAAGLSYSSSLGGVVSVSGWVGAQTGAEVRKRYVHPANKECPIFYSCGTADPAIDFKLGKRSGRVLTDALGEDSVSVMHVHRAAHAPKAAELHAVVQFMLNCLPHSPPPAAQTSPPRGAPKKGAAEPRRPERRAAAGADGGRKGKAKGSAPTRVEYSHPNAPGSQYDAEQYY